MNKFDNCHIILLRDVIVDTSIRHIYIVLNLHLNLHLNLQVSRKKGHSSAADFIQRLKSIKIRLFVKLYFN